jgi:hypothetical protein
VNSLGPEAEYPKGLRSSRSPGSTYYEAASAAE